MTESSSIRGGNVTASAARGSIRWRTSLFGLASIALSILVVFLVLFPLLRLLEISFFPAGVFDVSALRDVIGSAWLIDTVSNTLIVVAVSGTIAIPAGSLLAWLNERTDASLRSVGELLPLIPILVPSIAMAIGWVFLASPGSGFLNGALTWLLLPLGYEATIDIATWPGVIFAFTINAIPYVYLVVSGALRNLDPAMEEASRISGAGTWQTFRRVSVPAIKPALAAAALLVTIIGFGNYSIAIIVAQRAGIDVISVRIFQLLTVDYPPRFGQATVLCIFVLGIASSLWLLQRHFAQKGNFAVIGGRASQASVVQLGRWKWAARVCMLVYFACATLLPLFALAVVALQPFWNVAISPSEFTLDNFRTAFVEHYVTRQAFLNSLLLAAAGGLAAIGVGSVIALYARQSRSALAKLADGVTKLPALFSHLSLAVGFLVAFAAAPFHLGGTTWLLLLAYVVIFMPEASIAANAAVAQIGNELIEASAICGASEGRTFRKVIAPLMLPALVSGYALVFILISGEVTASALLATNDRPVIGYVIRSTWDGGSFGTLAALAGGFAFMNCIVALISFKLGKMRLRIP